MNFCPVYEKQFFVENRDADIVYGDELVIASNEVCWTWTVLVNDITSSFWGKFDTRFPFLEKAKVA